MKMIINIVFAILFTMQVNAQNVKGLFLDSCSNNMKDLSYFWKLDSLGRNGFRLYTYKRLIDCEKDKISQSYLIERLGKPNRTSTDNNGSIYYGYFFFDSRFLPKEIGFAKELLYIFFRFDTNSPYVSYIGEGHLD